jgi:hypothetical protein
MKPFQLRKAGLDGDKSLRKTEITTELFFKMVINFPTANIVKPALKK